MSSCPSNTENAMSMVTSPEDAHPMLNQIRVKKKVGTRLSEPRKPKRMSVQMEEAPSRPLLSNSPPEWSKKVNSPL